MPNIYRTNEGKLVEEDDPQAAYLVHAEGTEPDYEVLTPELAKALRERLAADKKAPRAQDKAEAEPPATKAVAGPEENKGK